MKVEELMSRDVISVAPDTSLKDVAALLVSAESPECRSSTVTVRSSESFPRPTS